MTGLSEVFASIRVITGDGSKDFRDFETASFDGGMNKHLVLLRIFAVVFFGCHGYCDVIVTEPTGGNDVPADRAMNSTNGAAYTPLGDIVITEGSANDFAPGAGQTLILTIPAGWRFSTTGASVSFVDTRDIASVAAEVLTSDGHEERFTRSPGPRRSGSQM